MKSSPPCVVENLAWSRGNDFQLAIDRFSVGPGEIVCLVGPIGSGKTTLLRALTGLERVDSGNLKLFDHPAGASPAPLTTRRRIALVPQRPLLLSGSVRYNVEYPLRIRGDKTPERQALGVLEGLGIVDLASRDTQELSGGQIQLVALARALVVGPELLLLDEPTSHLDPARVALVEEVVRERRVKSNLSVVWATHQLFQAKRCADRVMLLLDGRPVETASSEDFFERPRDPRTAAFVQGTMVY